MRQIVKWGSSTYPLKPRLWRQRRELGSLGQWSGLRTEAHIRTPPRKTSDSEQQKHVRTNKKYLKLLCIFFALPSVFIATVPTQLTEVLFLPPFREGPLRDGMGEAR